MTLWPCVCVWLTSGMYVCVCVFVCVCVCYLGICAALQYAICRREGAINFIVMSRGI